MNPHTPEGSPLGRNSPNAERFDPSLLYPLPRQPQRAAIGIAGELPFLGADAWTAYELSWLNPKGKPQVALAHISVPCESSHMVESKSFKLYLNSLNQTAFESAEAVREQVRQDISTAVWWGGPVRALVGISLRGPDAFALERLGEPEGLCLDRLDVECQEGGPAPECLAAALDEKPVQETLYTQLFRSNCPVTGQPDWASVQLRYSGPQIDQAGLLRYLVSFRSHNGFHEACVERIFQDVWRQCKPAQLQVHARFTRRGGLDINPWRSSHPCLPPATTRSARQ